MPEPNLKMFMATKELKRNINFGGTLTQVMDRLARVFNRVRRASLTHG